MQNLKIWDSNQGIYSHRIIDSPQNLLESAVFNK